MLRNALEVSNVGSNRFRFRHLLSVLYEAESASSRFIIACQGKFFGLMNGFRFSIFFRIFDLYSFLHIRTEILTKTCSLEKPEVL